MGVLDKFLDIMKLSDDDDYYDDDDLFDDEYEDDYNDRPSKRNLFSRSRKEDYDEDEGYGIKESKPSKRNALAHSTKNSKITPMRQPSRRSAPVNMEVCVIKPASVDDAREIAETLLNGSTVILNLEGLDLEIAQRITDFTSGATFAIDGNLQKISNYIFLVTPTNVDISGDLQNLLGSSMDSSPIGGGY